MDLRIGLFDPKFTTKIKIHTRPVYYFEFILPFRSLSVLFNGDLPTRDLEPDRYPTRVRVNRVRNSSFRFGHHNPKRRDGSDKVPTDLLNRMLTPVEIGIHSISVQSISINWIPIEWIGIGTGSLQF